MNIPVTYHAITSVSNPGVYIKGGVITYDLDLRCDHQGAIVLESQYPFATYSVMCPGCRGEELTELEADGIIEDYLLESMEAL